ncbi:L,D-transpeptidase [Burkholderia sp. Ac-20365]|jgi:hypothetical protein|uniref:L,D-transpeptidase n=1 Tax=Burkholderia sp. Ac-20365 TaxID=2703897 RepID=UPI00197BEADC|nr:L,D-transpeptidase [Burkholderia sp. Ac-20365]MBN3760238.1 L,D-transpeptidase [Burkholderia sp. Ac-20365]
MTSHIQIDVARQVLHLNIPSRSYRISTAANGIGCISGSYRTPTGKHRIKLKIGHDCPSGTIFSRRRPTGEVLGPELHSRSLDRDWILTRILWLDGLEDGINRRGKVDTLRRYIYIHGTANEDLIGNPVSRGCIRMRNEDILELFELVTVGTVVQIS